LTRIEKSFKIKHMNKTLPFTIVNNKHIRGILAPAELFSQKMLEDIIDFVELSTKSSIAESDFLVKDGNQKDSWVELSKVKKLADDVN